MNILYVFIYVYEVYGLEIRQICRKYGKTKKSESADQKQIFIVNVIRFSLLLDHHQDKRKETVSLNKEVSKYSV